MYVVKSDFNTVIKDAELQKLATDAELTSAIRTAESEAFGYLQHYDVKEVLKQTSLERHAKLVNVICDLTLYILVSKNHLSSIPEQRKDRYDEAIEWLRSVARGIIGLDLPKKETQKSVYWSTYPALGQII